MSDKISNFTPHLKSSQIFHIDSTNKSSGTHTDFYHKLDMMGNPQYTHVSVLGVSMPRTYYLVRNNYNTFTLQEGASQATITLPQGNYSQRAMKYQLASLLTAASPNGRTYTVTTPNTNTEPDTGKFTFTVNTGDPQFIFTTFLTEPLGFNPNTTYTFSGSSLTSPNVMKLISEDTIFIHSNIADDPRTDVLQELYSTSDPSFSAIVFQNPCPGYTAKKLRNADSNTYHFIITDENNNVIDTNGINVIITLIVYE